MTDISDYDLPPTSIERLRELLEMARKAAEEWEHIRQKYQAEIDAALAKQTHAVP